MKPPRRCPKSSPASRPFLRLSHVPRSLLTLKKASGAFSLLGPAPSVPSLYRLSWLFALLVLPWSDGVKDLGRGMRLGLCVWREVPFSAPFLPHPVPSSLWAQVFSSTTGYIESFCLPGILVKIRWDTGFEIGGELFKCEIIVNNAGGNVRELLPFEGSLPLPPMSPSWSSAVRVSLFGVWGRLWLRLDQAVLSTSLRMAAVSSAEGPIGWHSVADSVPHVLPAPLFGNTGLSLCPHCLLIVWEGCW